MTAFVLAMATGGFLAVALAGSRPVRPDLKASIDTLRPRDLGIRRGATAPDSEATRLERVGEWSRRRTARWRFLQSPERDLDLMQIPPDEHYGRKTISAAGAFAAATLLPMLMGLGFALPFLFGLVAALMGWLIPDLATRDKARLRREDFAYAAVSYLRLVAISRAAGAGLVTSLESAASSSGSWMFSRIASELRLAKLAGIPAWDALENLSKETDVPELREVADIIRLADRSGAAVADNLMARAASLRDRLLTREQTAANAKTASMSIPLAALAGIFLLAMLIPTAMRIMTI